MSIGASFLVVAILLADQPAASVPSSHQMIPVDQADFVLKDGNDFCVMELDKKTSGSVLVNFYTKRGVGELLVRRSGTEVDYSLTNPVRKIERWQKADTEKTLFSLAGVSGGNRYEGTLTVLKRAGATDGLELKMSRNGKALNYDCGSDFSEKELNQ